jgi:lipid-binding SYLF domain-containing protein
MLYRFICTQLFIVTCASLIFLSSGCATTPDAKDQASVIADSQTATEWFTSNVSGLSMQLEESAGYITYPGIGQYGIIITGGRFGRGVVYDNADNQIGWAYLNTASAGLQIGAQGFKMLVVFQNSATMDRFQKNKLTGNVGATVVAANSGAAGTSSFTDGVAVYQGAQTGLMAGASVGLDYMRYEAIKP